jgi:hypothetical protein
MQISTTEPRERCDSQSTQAPSGFAVKAFSQELTTLVLGAVFALQTLSWLRVVGVLAGLWLAARRES